MIKQDVLHFLKAWAAAVLTSSGIILLFSVPMGIGMMASGDPVIGLWVAISPAAIASLPAAAGMVLVALPATWWLARRNAETRRRYIWAGVAAGVILPFVGAFIDSPGDPASLFIGGIFAIFGAIAGYAAGTVWGDYRLRRKYGTGRDNEETATGPASPNPIHELLF